MKEKIISFLVGFIIMGLVYGLILYFFKEGNSVREIVYQSVFFGFGWGLAEAFLFPCIRKRFGKENK